MNECKQTDLHNTDEHKLNSEKLLCNHEDEVPKIFIFGQIKILLTVKGWMTNDI